MNFEKFQFPSRRSNIIARNGLVATSQPLAAMAGLDVLKAGGNAVDAAIATVATLCVVEPCSTGIGGDAFALIWQADEQKLYGLNASGPAPQALTAEFIRNQGHKQFPPIGGLAVTVPGSLRGWQLALEKFGSMGLDTLLSRPIAYARDGYPVSQRIARAWECSTEKMSRLPDSKRVWLPNGRSPRAAELFQNPEFARTLQTIVENGVDAFYRGDIARQIAQAVQADGGFLTEDDLANYQAEWVEPIGVEYKDGFVFHEIPPNGQGLTALLAINIAKQFDLPALGYGTADYYHALIEAMKLAFADAHAYHRRSAPGRGADCGPAERQLHGQPLWAHPTGQRPAAHARHAANPWRYGLPDSGRRQRQHGELDSKFVHGFRQWHYGGQHGCAAAKSRSQL